MRTYPKQCGAHARHILRLKESYLAEDIHKALVHALRYGAFKGTAVERILQVRFTPRTLESVRNERARRSLDAILPPVTQRPLEEYGDLFGQREEKEDAGDGDPRPDQDASGRLKLTEIRKILDDELAHATQNGRPVTELLERLLAKEAHARTERRIERRIQEAKLPERKLLSDFDFDFQTGVDKAQILELATLDFVRRKQGLVLAGNSGTGKSHLAKALLLIGCTQLFRCRYTTAADMLLRLLSGLADQTLPRKLRQYTSPDILLMDEVGFDRLEQHDARNASLFFKVIDGRYGKGSTFLTTNIDFKQLGDYLGDPFVTTAIVDRMVHRSIMIHIEGPSFRMHESKILNATTKTANTTGSA